MGRRGQRKTTAEDRVQHSVCDWNTAGQVREQSRLKGKTVQCLRAAWKRRSGGVALKPV